MTEKSDIQGLISNELTEPAPLHLPAHLTYAAVVDVRNAEIEITDRMVRKACIEAESLEVFPFAARKGRRA